MDLTRFPRVRLAHLPVLGIGVRAPKDKQEASVRALADKTLDLFGKAGKLNEQSVVANCNYVGKGMAGMIDLIRQAHFRKGQRIVFLHTGGSAALFGYHGVFDPNSTYQE